MKKNKTAKEPLRCVKCGYFWIPRVNHLPKECPECKTRRWMKK